MATMETISKSQGDAAQGLVESIERLKTHMSLFTKTLVDNMFPDEAMEVEGDQREDSQQENI